MNAWFRGRALRGDRPGTPVRAATAGLFATIALFVALVALAAASGRAPTPATVISQAKAKECQSAEVGGRKAVKCFGLRGRRGRRGKRGFRGLDGLRGAKGAAGVPGAGGALGPVGVRGPKGEDGNQGPDGDQGTAGADNNTKGADGTDGTDNATKGATGPSDAYISMADSTVLPESGGQVTVVSKDLPAGSYAMFVKGYVQNTADGDVVDDGDRSGNCGLARTSPSIIDADATFDLENDLAGFDTDAFGFQYAYSNLPAQTMKVVCSTFRDGVTVHKVVFTAIKLGAAQ